MSNETMREASLNRRKMLTGAVLSTGALYAMVDMATPAYAKGKGGAGATAQDVQLLNAAIALEHEGIAAYDIAGGSGLIPAAAVPVLTTFQGHHKQHRDELSAIVRRLGGKPVEAKPLNDYVVSLNAASIKTLEDIQRLALRLERGAASAYLGLIDPLSSHELHKVVSGIAADEALHAAAFMFDLKEAIPSQAHIFG